MEQHYNSLIKKSVKQDKASWFHKVLDQGDWDAIQKFRKAGKIQSSKLTVNGKTLADRFEPSLSGYENEYSLYQLYTMNISYV